MTVEWHETTIGDVCTKVVTGGTPLTSNEDYYRNASIPWLKTKEVNFCRIYGTENFVSEIALRETSVKLIPKNSVIVAMYGQGDTAGRVAINKVPLTTNQACCNLVIDEKKADYQFVYFYLMHSYSELVRRKTGSAQPNLNTNIVKAFEINLPPLEVQKTIAHILGTLDDKIELNRQMNATLEAMAQALFKSWFVDFDPVIDNALAAGNPIPEPLQPRAEARAALGDQRKPLPKAIQQQFPNRFVFNEDMGWVPEGWSFKGLGDLIDFATGPAFKSNDFTDSGIRLARGDNVKEGYFHWADKTRYWPKITSDLERYQLNTGDILIGMDGSKVGKNWVRVGAHDLPCLLVQRVARLRPNGLVGSSFLEVLIGSRHFKQYVENVKTGTSIPHISGGQIKAFPILSPEDKGGTFNLFEDLLKAPSRQRERNLSEVDTLGKLRDTLLPKLLSGQLRIPEAEQQLAEAL